MICRLNNFSAAALLAVALSLQNVNSFAPIETKTTAAIDLKRVKTTSRLYVSSERRSTEELTNTVDGAKLGFFDIFQQQQQHNDNTKRPSSSHVEENRMMDQVQFLQKRVGEDWSTQSNGTSEASPEKLLVPVAVAAALGIATVVYSTGFEPSDAIGAAQGFFANPQQTLQNVIDTVEAMGPLGPLYFGIFYLIAELLAIPATPLTMSAGYLFGLGEGTAVVLTAATIAASISFFVGKTFLRSWVESVLAENPKFAKLDKAIGEEGFKLLLLVRLSPIFPFALSNYLYGASSINFPSYFWGTLLGFAPGTLGFIYTGMVGKELTLGGDESQPWYIYAAGFAAILTFMKLVTDVASNIVGAIDDDDDTNAANGDGAAML